MSVRTKRVTTVAVAAALCLGVGLPAQAADATGAEPEGKWESSTAESYEEAIHLLDPYVVVTKEGTFTLTATAAEAGVDQATYDALADGMAEINGVLRLEGASPGVVVAVPGETGGIGILAQENRVIFHWWGWEVWLDSSNSNGLAGLVGVAAGVFAFFQAIFGNVVGVGIAVAVATMSGGAILWCNRSGRGIKIIKPIPVPVPYCTSQ